MKPYGTTLTIEPRPSRVLAGYLLGVHVLAIVLVWTLAAGTTVTVLLSLLTAVSLRWSWRRRPGNGNCRIPRRVVWLANGSWRVDYPHGRQHRARLLGSGLVQPWCIVLNLAVDEVGCQAMVLPAGCCDPELLRQLRVRLRNQLPPPGIGQESGSARRLS